MADPFDDDEQPDDAEPQPPWESADDAEFEAWLRLWANNGAGIEEDITTDPVEEIIARAQRQARRYRLGDHHRGPREAHRPISVPARRHLPVEPSPEPLTPPRSSRSKRFAAVQGVTVVLAVLTAVLVLTLPGHQTEVNSGDDPAATTIAGENPSATTTTTFPPYLIDGLPGGPPPTTPGPDAPGATLIPPTQPQTSPNPGPQPGAPPSGTEPNAPVTTTTLAPQPTVPPGPPGPTIPADLEQQARDWYGDDFAGVDGRRVYVRVSDASMRKPRLPVEGVVVLMTTWSLGDLEGALGELNNVIAPQLASEGIRITSHISVTDNTVIIKPEDPSKRDRVQDAVAAYPYGDRPYLVL